MKILIESQYAGSILYFAVLRKAEDVCLEQPGHGQRFRRDHGVRAGEATHEVGTELATAGARRGAGQRILAVEAEHRHQLARR